MARRTLVWVFTLLAVVALGVLWTRGERRARPRTATLFARDLTGCAIVIPADATAAERRAAEMLQTTLAQASGRAPGVFRIVPEGLWSPARGIFVGATRRAGGFLAPSAKPPYDTQVGWAVADGALVIRSERRDSIASAASWFLEQQLEARWFMPGPLGESVPRRAELTLAESEQTTRPGFLSRDLGLEGDAASRDWYARNRLEARFDHGHNYVNIFRPADFARTPEMAPMRGGQRFLPAPDDQNWQPNLVSPAAVQHAADVAGRAFAADPQRLSFSLSENDTVRFDDSAETRAAVAPPRFFRHRPDYSNLVFRFTNAVAEKVAQQHPDRWLPAYAYYWCENAPDFPVARHVVPFLTADRSQWSYPDFAAEDRALIERWCRSGAEIVGVYDYFYGQPFFSPRPTLYAVTETIPFEHRAGVKAFFAETSPNWALDGPKAWLAAQLLWAPQQDSAALLDLYYREFWGEAEAPMRAFFAICERVWREQPGPALWLRYFKDDDQAAIYPPESRAQLRAELTHAAAAATTAAVRARVAFTAAGLSVSEAYWNFSDARDRAARLARGAADPAGLLAAWKSYRAAREAFLQRHAAVRREHPLALAAQDLAGYLRNEPDSRIARELACTAAGRATLEKSAAFVTQCLGATPAEVIAATTAGLDWLDDAEWKHVAVGPVDRSDTIDWTPAGSGFQGSGEPWEGRRVEMRDGPDGRRVLRMAGCRTEGLGRWESVTPNAVFVAQVKVRAKSSPGTATFLIVSFLDEKGRHLGLGRVDRLPADAAVQETELCVIAKAPPNANAIGIAVRVLNQIGDDFAEFSHASLRRVP